MKETLETMHQDTVATLSEREAAYRENLRIRRQNATGMFAWACLNLTQNKIMELECFSDEWRKAVESDSVDTLLERLRRNAYIDEEFDQYKEIKEREAIIQMYCQGKSHFSIKYYNHKLQKYFQGTFDLIMNPTTYDIEAFAMLLDTTDEVITDEILKTLYKTDYESIMTIDAETGEAHPYLGERIRDVMALQKDVGDNVAGVEAYLRKYCMDDDVDRVILETSLPYVKEQLKTRDSHTVAYSLKLEGKVQHMRVIYAYIGTMKRLILCAMQNVTNTYRERVFQRDRLSEMLQTIQEWSGLEIGRYDLKTKRFYGNGRIVTSLGYDDVIEDAPDTFIKDENVAPDSIQAIKEFFERLRQGEETFMDAYLRATNGAFHLFKANAKIISDEYGQPYQAIIVFQDVDEMRMQSDAYRRIRNTTQHKAQESYRLYRCNLSRDAVLNRVEGALPEPAYGQNYQTLSARTKVYAEKYVHPDDAAKLIKLLRKDKLLDDYEHGIRELTLDYREWTDEQKPYRQCHIKLEMEHYPDCTDIELLLLFYIDQE